MIKLLAALAAMLVTQGVFYSLNMGLAIIVTWVIIAVTVSLVIAQVERGRPHVDAG